MDIEVHTITQYNGPKVFLEEILKSLKLTQTYDYFSLFRLELIFKETNTKKIIYPINLILKEDSVIIQDHPEEITLTQDNIHLNRYPSFTSRRNRSHISIPISNPNEVRLFFFTIENE